MLDPRLVPWPAVIVGVCVALPFALAAFFFYGRRVLAMLLLTIAPVAGWAAAIWKLQGLPQLPPLDAPLWAFWLAIAAVPLAIIGLFVVKKPGLAMKWSIYILIVIGLWAAATDRVFSGFISGEEARSIGYQECLVLGMTGCFFTVFRRRTSGLSAEFTPWLTALTATSVCLALTGTASVSLLALTLCFAAIPGALVLLARARTGRSGIAVEGVKSPGRQWQVVTLPLAFALPVLVISGAALASTPWDVAAVLLLTPVVGLLVLRLFLWLMELRFPAGGWKIEVLAIIVALAFSAVPAGIASYIVMKAAAAEKAYY